VTTYTLSLNPGGIEWYPHGIHNPSAVIFEDSTPLFGAEEERFTRDKHATFTFPRESTQACLDAAGIDLGTVDTLLLPWDMRLQRKRIRTDFRQAVELPDSLLGRLHDIERTIEDHLISQVIAPKLVRNRLERYFDDVPPIETRAHHRCHAASAFHPTEMTEALVVTVDGYGEYDSTVVWQADRSGLERARTYEYPNSLGHFYRVVTTFLGYPAHTRSEGKVMGLAPYGSHNDSIERTLRSLIDIGVDYNVTELTKNKIERGVQRLETAFDRSRKDDATDFSDWEQDLAYVTQELLEETMVDIVETYCARYSYDDVGLAGGVALNCKMNKRIMESDLVENVFIQPVAHDGGITLGACLLEFSPTDVEPMTNVYWGTETGIERIKSLLDTNKIAYMEPDDLYAYVADRLTDGELVGWFQGHAEMGPRALGNRSILADPRTPDSRDRVNKYVKHREEWRPFAPSMLEEAIDEYLVDAEPSPYMIKTFDTRAERKDEITATLHPADDTTRPQTVTEEQNPRYYRLISAFEDRTGVPVVLNTSFNDHGEPIVNHPSEAVKNFYNTGLDLLVLQDIVIEKPV